MCLSNTLHLSLGGVYAGAFYLEQKEFDAIMLVFFQKYTVVMGLYDVTANQFTRSKILVIILEENESILLDNAVPF